PAIEPQCCTLQCAQIAVQESQVCLIRNLLDLYGDSRGYIGKISGYFCNRRFKALLYGFFHFFIFPPRLRDVMISQNFSITYDETGTEEILTHLGSPAFERINNVAVAIFERLTGGSNSPIAQQPAATLIAERHRYVQQANTGCIRSNHAFGGFR